jgi:hypothetical protein
MNHFVKIDTDNIVTEIIASDQNFIDSGAVGNPSLWIETGDNFRGRFAGIGFTYDKTNDVFISPKPYPSWALDASFDWQPPTAMPDDDKKYSWNEDTQSWNNPK